MKFTVSICFSFARCTNLFLNRCMQDVLRTSFESLLVPAFEQSCKTMFEQVDSAFQKGMSEHAVAIQQQVEAAHTPLVLTLKVGL